MSTLLVPIVITDQTPPWALITMIIVLSGGLAIVLISMLVAWINDRRGR